MVGKSTLVPKAPRPSTARGPDIPECVPVVWEAAIQPLSPNQFVFCDSARVRFGTVVLYSLKVRQSAARRALNYTRFEGHCLPVEICGRRAASLDYGILV